MKVTAVKELTIRAKTEGVTQSTADLKNLSGAMKGVETSASGMATVTDKLSKTQLSVANDYAKQTMRLDALAKSQTAFAKEVAIADKALAQAQIGGDAYLKRLDLINAKFANVEVGMTKFNSALMNQARMIDQRLGVKTDFGGAERAKDIEAYGKGLDDLRAKYNPLYAAGRTYKATLDDINQAHRVGAITEKERVAEIQRTKDAFVQQVNSIRGVNTETKKMGAGVAESLKPARYELINLGRQIQDIGVSLSGGQSFGTVLIQQGSQILDIFAASKVGAASFFTTSIAWAGRFVTSIAGITTGLLAAAGAAGYMAQSFASAQKEITKTLTGLGAGAGLTRGDVNQIAESVGTKGGMSISEAQAAVLEFAKTGVIYADNIKTATEVTRQFALATGTDAAEATKKFAGALVDPARGAVELNKEVRFLNASTLGYIETLQAQGKLQEAQAALMAALGPKLKEQADQVGVLTRMWNSAWEGLKNYVYWNGQRLAQDVQRVTGADLGGFSNEQNLARAQARLQSLQQMSTQGLDTGSLKAYEEALASAYEQVIKFQTAISELAAKTEQARIDKLSLDAKKYAEDIIPAIQQTQQLSMKLAELQNAIAAGVGGPFTQAALDIGRMQLDVLNDQIAAEQKRAQIFNDNAATYSNMSATAAQQMPILNAQLDVAKAIGDAAKEEAQYRLRILELTKQFGNEQDAILIAEKEREISRAKQDNNRYQERQRDLVRETATSESEAADEAARMARNARETADATNRAAQAAAEMQARWEAAYQAAKFLPFNLLDQMGGFEGLYQSKQGGWSQFDPAGYTSTYDPLNLIQTKKSAEDLVKAFGGKVEQRTQGIGPNQFTYYAYVADPMKKLEDSITKNSATVKDNTDVTRENTQTMTDVLSPYYSQDPRHTYLGFRAFREGGIMTSRGELPLKQYQGGGVATSPQVAVFGEGNVPEAFIPMPRGHVPVQIKGAANTNRPINVLINVQGNADAQTVNALKTTGYQQAQAMRRAIV